MSLGKLTCSSKVLSESSSETLKNGIRGLELKGDLITLWDKKALQVNALSIGIQPGPWFQGADDDTVQRPKFDTKMIANSLSDAPGLL